jgi:hypothetical protein
MTDDVSKLFPYAMSLLMELEARAVIVLAYGSAWGTNGCAPALLFDQRGTPEAIRSNTTMVRAIANHLRMVADRLESDMVAQGIEMEPRS